MIPEKIKILKLIDKNGELNEIDILNTIKKNHFKNKTFISQLAEDGFIKVHFSKYVLTSLGYQAIFANSERIFNKILALITLAFSIISLTVSILTLIFK